MSNIYIVVDRGVYMAEKMKCINAGCRVDEYYLGDWQAGVWEHEDESAWSMLKIDCCPGCSEVGEKV